MKKINYAIISYHRPECVTIRTLLELGIEKSDITVFLQDRNDCEAYKVLHPEINLVLVEGKGCSVNRNNVLRYDGYSVGDWVCMLDDDVLSFTKMKLFAEKGQTKATSRKIYDKKVFEEDVAKSFSETEQIGSVIWGCSPTGNAMFAKTRLLVDGEFSVNKLFQGGLVGHIIDKKTYYNETYRTVEDYEIQLRIISSGGLTIRKNDIATSKKPNRNYKGGLFEIYRTDATENDLDRLCAEYSRYVKVKPDYSGVIQII